MWAAARGHFPTDLLIWERLKRSDWRGSIREDPMEKPEASSKKQEKLDYRDLIKDMRTDRYEDSSLYPKTRSSMLSTTSIMKIFHIW